MSQSADEWCDEQDTIRELAKLKAERDRLIVENKRLLDGFLKEKVVEQLNIMEVRALRAEAQVRELVEALNGEHKIAVEGYIIHIKDNPECSVCALIATHASEGTSPSTVRKD